MTILEKPGTSLALSADNSAATLMSFRKRLSGEGAQLLVYVLLLYKPWGYYSKMSKSLFHRQSCLGGEEGNKSRCNTYTHCKP